jgi:peptide deformylase
MAILPLVIAPDERLLQPSLPVKEVNDSVRALCADMLDTMYAHQGIGLAAVQVGVHQTIIVVDIAQREDGKSARAPMIFINPEIVESSQAESVFTEGCLSFPDQYSDVTRPESITVRYLDETGTEKTLHAEGILATCLQHEIDHTKGIVFVDHISKLKRDMILRRLSKAKRLGMISDMPEPNKASS